MVHLIPAGCGKGAPARCALGRLRGTGKQPLVEGEEVGVCKSESNFRAVRPLSLNAQDIL